MSTREQRIAGADCAHSVPFDLKWKCTDVVALSDGEYCVVYIEHVEGDRDMTLHLKRTGTVSTTAIPVPEPEEPLERPPKFDWKWD